MKKHTYVHTGKISTFSGGILFYKLIFLHEKISFLNKFYYTNFFLREKIYIFYTDFFVQYKCVEKAKQFM